MGEKTFLVGIQLERGERGGGGIGGHECFLPGPIKMFSPQNGEKTEWEIEALGVDENALHWVSFLPLPVHLSLFSFLFFFPFDFRLCYTPICLFFEPIWIGCFKSLNTRFYLKRKYVCVWHCDFTRNCVLSNAKYHILKLKFQPTF